VQACACRILKGTRRSDKEANLSKPVLRPEPPVQHLLLYGTQLLQMWRTLFQAGRSFSSTLPGRYGVIQTNTDGFIERAARWHGPSLLASPGEYGGAGYQRQNEAQKHQNGQGYWYEHWILASVAVNEAL
jgi:hypothetical protein